ncbi:MAG: PQQ-dependent sugar dehydrogenase [Verrucomicrobiota bacterium]
MKRLLVWVLVSSSCLHCHGQLEREANTTLTLPDELPTFEGFRFKEAFSDITFESPVAIVQAPGQLDNLYVVEQTGRVYVISDLSGTPEKSLFLDISELVRNRGEQGLLGMDFHPRYIELGYFYVFYTTPGDRRNVLSRFSVSSRNRLQGDPNSELILINQVDDAGNHNGGDVHFGPDGYLYISLGDEGGADDRFENSQRIDKDFFSGIIRIDVDKKPGSLEPNPHDAIPLDNGVARYGIPPDNPFVGATEFIGLDIAFPSLVREEFWAVGLRNPWRMSFDIPTGRLFVGDVGQDQREEVDLITKGGNYGWRYFEGTIRTPGVSENPPAGLSQIDPIFEYAHEGAQSVIGGIVYRGPFSELSEKYITADSYDGRVWALIEISPGVWESDIIANEPGLVAFGSHPISDNLLAVNIGSGRILELEGGNISGSPIPEKLSDTGAFSDLVNFTPYVGIVEYAPNVSFWSDYAKKRRWFSIPNLDDDIVFSSEGNWAFPTGMVWIKHFDLEFERGNPASERRVETRFLVKTDSASYGLSYRWNEEQTDAFLVDQNGMEETFTIDDGGVMVDQTWLYPSRNDCRTCHTDAGGHALSFNTRQLNRERLFGAESQNQLVALRKAGYFTNGNIGKVSSLPKVFAADDLTASLETKVKSYLDVNCVSCHQPGGTSPTSWDARFSTPIEEMGLIRGLLSDDGGDSESRAIVPGAVEKSVLLHRLQASDGFSRMPPLASYELDEAAIAMITEWVENVLPYPPVPGKIQVEEFKEGGSGVAYFDKSSGNEGGAYRDTDVDIQSATEGGFNVSSIQRNEWLAYDMNVATPGYYQVFGRVASDRTSNKQFHLELGEVDITGPITFNTDGAGLQAWQDVTGPVVWLDSGIQELRLVFGSRYFNMNWLEIRQHLTPVDDYLSWEIVNGLAENSGDLDTDNDGYINRYEYFFGTNPNSAINSRKLDIMVNDIFSTFTYTRRSHAPGITYRMEVSEDLTDGSWVPIDERDTSVILAPVSNGDGTETLTIQYDTGFDEISGERLFFRIKAEN